MHNLTKIRLFRLLLLLTYPVSLIFLFPAALLKKKNAGNLFFFFDRYVIGGAQRIHIDILNSINEKHKQLYFTRKSQNNFLKDEFYSFPNTIAKDIHFWCDNLLFRLFTVHYYSFYINRHKNAHVFSANSTFFYDMLPFLKKSVVRTELLHNFTHGKNGMEFFGLANHKLLTYRIVYDNFTLSNIKKQYTEYNVEPQYLKRILFIEPGVTIPDTLQKDFSLPLKVLYAGRGGEQKRIWLLNKIAEQCITARLPVEFHFAGTMMSELSDTVKQHSVLHGEISDPKEMYHLYDNSHIILMTSAYEGFPMLIKESMACGCVPVVTALEGNKMHLTNGNNSLLIENWKDENAVVSEGVKNIELLINDPTLLKLLSTNAYTYAQKYFDRQKFIEHYRAFFKEASWLPQ